jgi:hypothetical protein
MNQKKLKKYLRYDPETGIFTRIYNKTRTDIIDDEVSHRNDSGYVVLWVNCEQYRAHRLAWLYMTGKWPNGQIDHINGIRDDNRWRNLRDTNSEENSKNSSTYTNNTSGYRGVNLHNNKFRAYINSKGKQIFLGYFNSFELACMVRRGAEMMYGYHENHGR